SATCPSNGAATTTNPVPALTDNPFTPNYITAGSKGVTLKVAGTNFVTDKSTVNWNDKTIKPKSSSASELSFVVPDDDVQTATKIKVSVTNPSPGGGISNVVELEVK